MTTPRRTLIGTKSGISRRTRVYLAGDAIEVDEIDGYSGDRSRVLLDEVRVITFDRRRSTTLLVWLGLLTAFLFGIFALSLLRDGGVAAVFFASFITSPLWILFLLHAFLGVDYVTVFGKRSNASMSFSIRKAKARRTFSLLCERVTQAQEEARARFAAEAAQELPGLAASSQPPIAG